MYGLLTSEAVSGGKSSGSLWGLQRSNPLGAREEVRVLWGSREHFCLGQHINNNLLIHFNLHKTIIFFSCSNVSVYRWLGF